MYLEELIETLKAANAALTTNDQLAAGVVREALRADKAQSELDAARVEIERLKAMPRLPATPIPFALTNAAAGNETNADLAALKTLLIREPLPNAPFAIYPDNQAYTYGRVIRERYMAVLLACLKTGDLALLAYLENVMNGYEAEIRKAAVSPYGVYESLMASLILLHTLMMKQNGREWEKWLTIFESRYPAGVPTENLTHCCAANIECYSYLIHLDPDNADHTIKRDGLLAEFHAAVTLTTRGGVWRINERAPVLIDERLT